MKIPKSIFLSILTISIFIVGFNVYEEFSPTIKLAYKSSEWPKVKGIITTSERVNTTPDLSSSRAVYETNFMYKYSVEGKSYFGSKIYIGNNLSSQQSLAQYIDKYEAGREVHVYHSPLNPSLAVIEPGIKLDSLFVPIIAATIILGALLAILTFIIKELRQKTITNKSILSSTGED